ncbi:MAG: helix-turn-helix transcriptional regulator [Oscillibacter sp.]|jgi:DNA-binding XRE family transcriptional regulator|nr:helix-turn-helix transcriptional regulator [Oscillibacter sp.]MCI9376046.1 helix-turn-helix transcriptional regulator [Oscillibacter sp.]
MITEIEKEQLRKKMSSSFRAARKELDLSQEKMAELLGISARSYEDLEHGINLCSAIVLLRFLSRSGVNAAKLLEELNTLLTSE